MKDEYVFNMELENRNPVNAEENVVFLGVHKPITPRLLDDGRIQTCPRYNPKQSYQRQKKLLIVSTVVFAAVIIIIASVLCFFVISYYLTSKEINQQTQSGISNSTILPGAKERSDSITTSRYVVPFVENTSFAAVNASVFINILKQAPVDTFTSQSSSHSKTAKALIASSLSTITTKSTDQSVLSDASSTHLYELKPTSTAITQNVIVSSAEIPRISTKPYSSAQSTTQTYTSHLIPTNTVTNFSTLELNEASSAIAKNSQSGYSTLAPFSGSLDKTPFPNTQANYVAATTSASLQIKSEVGGTSDRGTTGAAVSAGSSASMGSWSTPTEEEAMSTSSKSGLETTPSQDERTLLPSAKPPMTSSETAILITSAVNLSHHGSTDEATRENQTQRRATAEPSTLSQSDLRKTKTFSATTRPADNFTAHSSSLRKENSIFNVNVTSALDVKATTTAAPSRKILESATQKQVVSDTGPVAFVRGRFTYYQAEETCAMLGSRLALREDMQNAYQAGYEKCVYGWLLDQHSGFVMQERGAKQKCGGGRVGVIYSSLRNPLEILAGAYCLIKKGPFDYQQGKDACFKRGTRLATKEDLLDAYEGGYQRCMYGWLSDGHMGYVMQKSGARETCSKGKHGLIYTSEKDPLTTAPGVYCLKTNVTSRKTTSGNYRNHTFNRTVDVLETISMGPLAFVRGKFNYYQAEEACYKLGARLSMKEDMIRAYQAGFQRCIYGWLLDQHSGFVMQKSGAKPKCGGGKVGLIYSSLRNPLDTVNGAYCLMKPVPIVFLPGKVNYNQAKRKCEDMGTRLALKDDMLTAFEAGYERCVYGWLLDVHKGFVMQESGAMAKCGNYSVGLIYSSYLDPNMTTSGAYCLKLNTTPEHAADSMPVQRTARSVNWWVEVDATDAYDLKRLLSFDWRETAAISSRNVRSVGRQPANLLGSVRAVYPCCNYFTITRKPKTNTSFVNLTRTVAQMRHLVDVYKRIFGKIAIRVLPHVQAHYDAMMQLGAATKDRSRIVDDLVSKAVSSGVDGVIMDYEPTEEYTREHALVYRDFVNELVDKMASHNLSVGMMVSGWGILKFYDVYSEARCEMFGSMANTYFGHKVSRNINNVREMLRHLSRQRLQVGLGSVQMENGDYETRKFGWTPEQMSVFIGRLRNEDVHSLHIFPALWGKANRTKNFFMKSLLDFVK